MGDAIDPNHLKIQISTVVVLKNVHHHRRKCQECIRGTQMNLLHVLLLGLVCSLTVRAAEKSPEETPKDLENLENLLLQEEQPPYQSPETACVRAETQQKVRFEPMLMEASAKLAAKPSSSVARKVGGIIAKRKLMAASRTQNIEKRASIKVLA